jgi:hypothetical protein
MNEVTWCILTFLMVAGIIAFVVYLMIKDINRKAAEQKEIFNRNQIKEKPNLICPEIQPEIQPEKKAFYVLKFYRHSGMIYSEFNNQSIKPLTKVYMWFLLRESPKYNIKLTDGMATVLRSEIAYATYIKEWK